MVDETEIKILDAALTEFAENGYNGATTKLIADKAGFSELTLFRKFENKENLFNMVVQFHAENFKRDYQSIIEGDISLKDEEFLKNIINQVAKLTEDNIEYIRLSVFERSMQEPIMGEFIYHLGDYLKENFQNDEINCSIIALIMTSSVIMLYNDKYLDRSFVDYEGVLDHLTNELSFFMSFD